MYPKIHAKPCHFLSKCKYFSISINVYLQRWATTIEMVDYGCDQHTNMKIGGGGFPCACVVFSSDWTNLLKRQFAASCWDHTDQSQGLTFYPRNQLPWQQVSPVGIKITHARVESCCCQFLCLVCRSQPLSTIWSRLVSSTQVNCTGSPSQKRWSGNMFF